MAIFVVLIVILYTAGAWAQNIGEQKLAPFWYVALKDFAPPAIALAVAILAEITRRKVHTVAAEVTQNTAITKTVKEQGEATLHLVNSAHQVELELIVAILEELLICKGSDNDVSVQPRLSAAKKKLADHIVNSKSRTP